MKKLNLNSKGLLVLISFLAIFLTAGTSQADLIGLKLGTPDIFSDSNGTYSYDAENDLFTSTASALNISFNGTPNITIIDGAYSVMFHVDNTGAFSGGYDGGDQTHDLEIYGTFTYDGETYGTFDDNYLLLAGEVTEFGYATASVDPTKVLFDFTFDATGGALAAFFTAGGGDEAFAGTSTWDGSSWTDSHEGSQVKHDTAPVPIPTAALIFGTGLIGLVGIRRKFRN